ncbi:MAG: class I SAM-dependent methyltransferase [Cyanobacteria bacterium NC_groundwater_1444_Ag_S-0.65um_54_12]|nr:class I SAM-dependent methyltransferase [Cyanobacteria bacterium NC_groundwater_1444_Ag_S-0.65um_54_12]
MELAPYAGYAAVYDRTGQSRFGLRMLSYAYRLWGERWPESVLDLACGTGATTVALALRGVQVAGLDRSQEMLQVAELRAKRWGVSPDWISGDYRKISLVRQFTNAICFYDALNYCQSINELEGVFRQVANCIKPGGQFLFDTVTTYGIRYLWGKQSDVRVDDDIVRVWRTSYDPRSELGTIRITYFLLPENESKLPCPVTPCWQRFDEVHQHRGFDPVEVHAALQTAGWEPRATYRCLSWETPDATSYRVAYLAERRS